MAVVRLMHDMKEENRKQLEEMKKAVLSEMKEELQSLIRQETRYAAEQELKGRKALHLLSEFERTDIIEATTESALKEIPKFFPKDGYSPRKGIDYWTQSEITSIANHLFLLLKQDLTLVAGEDYPTKEQMRNHVEECMEGMPKYNEDHLIKLLMPQVLAKFPKIELKGEDIVQKINALPVQLNLQIDARHIKNLPREHRQKLGASGGGGVTELTATGTVDGNNTAFTFTHKPKYIISDGGKYKENYGWTWSVLTATLSIPPVYNIWGEN